MLACIFDGYVDEPACLGVPPYLSPYPRYLAGALDAVGCDHVYITVDEWRLARGMAGSDAARGGAGSGGVRVGGVGGGGGRAKGKAHGTPDRGRPMHWSRDAAVEKWETAAKADLMVALWGALVPGKYLSATPASPRELEELAFGPGGMKVLGGPGAASFRQHHPGTARAFDLVLDCDTDAQMYALMREDSLGKPEAAEMSAGLRRSGRQRDDWAVRGAPVAAQHPDAGGPLLAELESYRGCVRFGSGGCSFCSDPEFGEPIFREPVEVAAEAKALAGVGVEHFRVGGQTCVFSYMADGVGRSETPEPDPKKVGMLFSGIRRAAPDLRVLHTDNANPAVVAAHPEKARDTAEAIVRHCTPGNTVALGLESADPAVKERNNLNATAGEAMTAIRVINEAGGGRGEDGGKTGAGLPMLLPGVNFVTGLAGETKKTLEHNRRFLTDVLDSGLLVRRVNIRRALMPGAGKPVASRIHRSMKAWVEESFASAMMERLAPDGTYLPRVFVERARGNMTFGRQAGSYPLLVGLPYPGEVGRWVDAAVTSRGPRSVGAVEVPLRVNDCPMDALTALPGVGKKRAASIVRGRPVKDAAHLGEILGEEELAVELDRYLSYD